MGQCTSVTGISSVLFRVYTIALEICLVVIFEELCRGELAAYFLVSNSWARYFESWGFMFNFLYSLSIISGMLVISSILVVLNMLLVLGVL